MSDFINTIDALGDDVVIDSIITKTITEFRDDTVTSIGDGVFAKCSSLTVVDTPAVTSIASYAFQYDTSLISINAPNVSGSLTPGVFQDCTSLESLDMPLITRVDRSALSACRALTHVCFPLATFLDTNSIRYCSSLISADFSSLTGFGGYVFAGADSIRALILRNTSSVVPLGNVYNLEYYDEYPFTKGEAYIYVPRALVDSYKTATNWSTFASKFRALEDYTVDGTVTGEVLTYGVTYNLRCVSSSNVDDTAVKSFYTVLTPHPTLDIADISVTMGGVDVTETAYDDGVIDIPIVTGDIVITASASTVLGEPIVASLPYNGSAEGELSGYKLNVTAGQTLTLVYYLTKQQGYVYDGRKCGLSYSLSNNVVNAETTVTLTIPSDGYITFSNIYSGAGNGGLAAAPNDRLYGQYLYVYVE